MELNDLAMHLLLSLRDTTATGYELTQSMSKSYVRRASHQQVYRELNKLCKRGLVHFVIEEQSGKPDRKPYSITSAGLNAIEATAISTSPKLTSLHNIRTVMIAAGNEKYFESLFDQLTTAIEDIKTKMIKEECPIERLAMSREIAIHTAEITYCSDVLKHLAKNSQSQAA
ncbi:PadR family transcriptional regulator [Vibrio sp.]|uniref:PadR family transcriptional regulator n=1 Tax=Vibrio sp. TaxID=678 RepID=UPI00378FF5C1